MITSLYINVANIIRQNKKYIITFSITGKSLIAFFIIVEIICEILSEIIKWQGVKK